MRSDPEMCSDPEMRGDPEMCSDPDTAGAGEASERKAAREVKQRRPTSPHAYLALRLELISRPGSVSLVRTLLRTIAQEVEIGSALLDDLCLAVSEACNNVVLHAYPGGSGPLIFSCTVRGGSVDAVVSDRGCGIASGSCDTGGLGTGLAVIRALAATVEFDSRVGLGTEVRMTFRRSEAVPQSEPSEQISPWNLPSPDPRGSAWAASGELLAQ
jgi:anti-sigma regulatory factor (Ser/Thr protein kinase)